MVVAAAVGANLVATKDPAFLDLAGPEYPLLIDWSPETIATSLQSARQSFNTQIWKVAREIMREVKDRTTPTAIAADWITFFRSLA